MKPITEIKIVTGVLFIIGLLRIVIALLLFYGTNLSTTNPIFYVMIIEGILFLFAGYGTWKLRKWGFYLVIIIAILAVVNGLNNALLQGAIIRGFASIILPLAVFYDVYKNRRLFS